MDCVFCSIIADELPSSRVYEDERVLGFMDINPVTSGHLLVIPRAHAPYLSDLQPDDAARMMVVAQQLAAALRASEIPVEGINLFLADGEVAMQEVFHAHLHVVPRTVGDGFTLTGNFAQPERAVLDAQATAIRAALG